MRAFRLILVLISLVLFYSCNNKETKETPQSLHIFNWTDYVGKNTLSTFEEKEGIKIIYDNYSSNEELLAKLNAGGASYDIIFPSDYAAAILLAKGKILPLVKDEIPNIKYVPEDFRSPYFDKEMNYCIPYTWSTTGIGYNIDFVSEDETESWSALFDPAYKDRILILDDPRATLGMALKYIGASANTINRSELNRATDLLIKQKPLVHVYTNDNLPQLFSSGEVVLGYGWSGDIRQAMNANPKIKYSIPKEGTLVYIDYVCISSSSNNPVLASKFINHLLEPVISLEIAKTTSYATTNKGAYELADKELKILWGKIFDGESDNNFESVKNLQEGTALYDEMWQKLKQK